MSSEKRWSVRDSEETDPEGQVSADRAPVAAETSEVVTTTIPAVVSTDAEDSEEPAEPAQSALALTTLATARSRADEDTAAEVGAQATTSLASDDYELPTDVLVREVRAPLEWLQEVPVAGRFVVTPIVHLLHAILFVSEIVHPLFGFPIDHTAAPGTPRARSVKVTSFDGAEIYVHFMPAKDLGAGESAPTVLNGPGVGLPGATTLNNRLDSFRPYDVVGVGKLREEGYNVVSWDPRGEWGSGGRMELQSPDFEGRDISHIISWLSTLDSWRRSTGTEDRDGRGVLRRPGSVLGGDRRPADRCDRPDHRVEQLGGRHLSAAGGQQRVGHVSERVTDHHRGAAE